MSYRQKTRARSFIYKKRKVTEAHERIKAKHVHRFHFDKIFFWSVASNDNNNENNDDDDDEDNNNGADDNCY